MSLGDLYCTEICIHLCWSQYLIHLIPLITILILLHQQVIPLILEILECQNLDLKSIVTPVKVKMYESLLKQAGFDVQKKKVPGEWFHQWVFSG